MMSSEREDRLFELEQRLAQVGRRLPSEEASSLIAADFVEFGASGKVWSKAEIIAAMSQWAPIERIVEDFRVRELNAFYLSGHIQGDWGDERQTSFSFFAQKFYMAIHGRKMADSLPPGNEREMRTGLDLTSTHGTEIVTRAFGFLHRSAE